MLDFLKKKKTMVIIDTNFLMLPGSRGIDIFSEIAKLMDEPHELYVVDKTLEELQTIISKDGKKKDGFNAKLGFILAKQKSLKTLTSSKEEYVDSAIVRIVSQSPQKTIVATQDKELQGELKKLSVRIITIKQQKQLALR